MSLSKATTLYESLKKTIQEFKSPAFRTFFKEKAQDDYKKLINDIDHGKYSCVLEKYIKEQSDLKEVLKRQSYIYNMNYDQGSNI